jgi:hypothetical protein
MTDLSSKESSTTDESFATRAVDNQAERERLIDDLAFLVVRQHHSQRAGMIVVPDDDTAVPMLYPNQKEGM